MATEDLKRRNAGDSIIITGRQKRYGEHLTGATVFNGDAPNWTDIDNITAALRRGRNPFVRNTLDPTSNNIESESIIGLNAASEPIIVPTGGTGEWEFELLPEDAIHLLFGWFNPTLVDDDPLIVNTTSEPNKALNSVKIAVEAVQGTGNAQKQKIAITNDTMGTLADWPGQLRLWNFPAVIAGTGQLFISGEQRRSRTNKVNTQTAETITVDAATLTKLKDASAGNGVLSKNFYRKINQIVLSGFTTFAGAAHPATLKLRFDPDTKESVLNLNQTNDVYNGWSVQMIKAFLPFVAYDVIPVSFRLRVSGGRMRLILEVVASVVQEGRTLQYPLDIAYQLPENNIASHIKKILTVYGYDNLDFYPAYGTSVALGEPGETLAALQTKVDAGTADIIPITEIEIIGNHNFGEDDTYKGDPAGGQPATDDNQTRTVNVNATVVHRTDASVSNNATAFWQDRFFASQNIPIIVQNYNWNSIGRQSRIESRFPNCKLVEVPGLPIEGSGRVNRRLAFQAFPSVGASSPDEISMVFHSKNGFQE